MKNISMGVRENEWKKNLYNHKMYSNLIRLSNYYRKIKEELRKSPEEK